jgi:flagellar basal body-associated protein FliL
VVLLAAAVLAVAAGTYYFVGTNRPPPPPKPVLVPIGTYVTNLDDPSIAHYIKITVEVLVPSKDQAQLLDQDRTSLESAVLTALRGTPVEAAMGANGTRNVARIVRSAVETGVPGVHVLQVFFTDFVVE